VSRRAGRIPVLLLTLLALFQTSRLLSRDGGAPAFFIRAAPRLQVALDGSWSREGVHQYFDDLARECVNVLTDAECVVLKARETSLISGMVLSQSQTESVRWMSAGQRMALQIPLHPDRMNQQDWQELPGIGPRLAEAIERDRQKSGDFLRLERVGRVKGIGPKRIAAWERYFMGP